MEPKWKKWARENMPPELFAEMEGDRDWTAEQLRKARAELGELRGALSLSAFDVSPCGACGLPVVCIPDGLPMCEPCAKRAEREQ